MRISFFTTVMNRLEHLQQTLPANLSVLNPDLQSEIIILDYNSNDGLYEWMMQNEAKMPGRVKYLKTTEPAFYHRAHARNLAALQAEGDILVNLDADNFIGEGFESFILDTFKSNPNTLIAPSANALSDVFGKMAFPKASFCAVNGYDEDIQSYGFEDNDLRYRLEASGLSTVTYNKPAFKKAITHSTEERIINEKRYKTLKSVMVQKIDEYRCWLMLINKNNEAEKLMVIDTYFEPSSTIPIRILESKERYVMKPASYSTSKKINLHSWNEIGDKTLKMNSVMFFSQLLNKNTFEENQIKKPDSVNQMGFGKGNFQNCFLKYAHV